jgi:mannose-1-phosphate guanylyltransferase
MNYAVVLAGGIGERLWPKSRASMPKHLQAIVGKKTMFQQAVDRVRGFVEINNVYVVTAAAQKKIILKQVPDLIPENVIGEPVGKNTAAAIGVAAMLIHSDDGNAVMASLHSDHYIEDVRSFQRVLKDCCAVAKETSAIVTIGIKPDYANTGFGYIHRAEKMKFRHKTVFHRATGFKEKPDEKTARKYLKSGEYLWNSGMFIWKTSVIFDEIKKNMPHLYNVCMKLRQSIRKTGFDNALRKAYDSLDSIPIDTGIMEKAKNVIMAEAAFDWDDVGSWLAVEKHIRKDDKGNAVQGEFVGIDSSGCIVDCGDSLVATAGVKDLIIVCSGKAVLVCHKNKAQDVKELVRALKSDPNMKKYT